MMKKIAIVENLMAKRPSDHPDRILAALEGLGLHRRHPPRRDQRGDEQQGPATDGREREHHEDRQHSVRPPARRVGLLLGVIRAADERSGLDVGEAERAADLGQLGELVGMVVAGDRQVRGARGAGTGPASGSTRRPRRRSRSVATSSSRSSPRPRMMPGFQRQPGRGGPRVPEQVEHPRRSGRRGAPPCTGAAPSRCCG